MDLKNLMIARIRQLEQEQANKKDYCIRHFGGFNGEVFVPVQLELVSDVKLVELFEQLVAAITASDSFSQ